MISGGVSQRVLGGPKSQHGKRGKMELLDTKTGLEGQGSKVNSEQHGKRGKTELLDTKTGLEGQGSKVNSEQHGKRGKRGKMELLDVKIGLEIRARKSTTWKGWNSWIWSTRKPLLPSFPCRWFWTPLHEPGFGVQELQFSTLSTFSMLFRLHFRTLPFESDFEVQELQFTFEPCPSSPILKSRSFSFPRFPRWLFEPSQHPPRKPWKSWKWWKRPAGDRSGALDGQERT